MCQNPFNTHSHTAALSHSLYFYLSTPPFPMIKSFQCGFSCYANTARCCCDGVRPGPASRQRSPFQCFINSPGVNTAQQPGPLHLHTFHKDPRYLLFSTHLISVALPQGPDSIYTCSIVYTLCQSAAGCRNPPSDVQRCTSPWGDSFVRRSL